MKKLSPEKLLVCHGGLEYRDYQHHENIAPSDTPQKIVVTLSDPKDTYLLKMNNKTYLLTYNPQNPLSKFHDVPVRWSYIYQDYDYSSHKFSGPISYEFIG